MDLKYIKEKAQLMRKRKKRNDRLLRIFVCIYILGYTFFFSSNLFFPKVYKGIDTVYVGEIIDLDEYVFTLDSWDYASDYNTFEIIFSVQNLTLNDTPKYEVSVRAGNKVFRSEIVNNISGEKLIVRVKDIPKRWTEVIATITADKKSVQIGMNDKKVTKVDRIEDRTDEEYIVYSMESKLAGIKKYVEEEKALIKELDSKILAAYEKLNVLTEDKEEKTEKEKAAIDKNKSVLASELEGLKGELDTKMIAIEEGEKRIKALEEKVKALTT